MNNRSNRNETTLEALVRVFLVASLAVILIDGVNHSSGPEIIRKCRGLLCVLSMALTAAGLGMLFAGRRESKLPQAALYTVFGYCFAAVMIESIVLHRTHWLAIVFAAAAFVLAVVYQTRKAFAPRSVPKRARDETFDEEKMRRLAEAVREGSRLDCIEITTGEADELPLCASKFGGMPYWPRGMAYPVDDRGRKLVLLAQIDLSELSCERLPDEGLLQFFISSDDACGLDMAQGSRVVYHESFDRSLTEEDAAAAGARSLRDADGDDGACLPLSKPLAISFRARDDYANLSEDCFDELALPLLRPADETEDKSVWEYLSDAEYYWLAREFDGTGHRLFGHPCFTQNDVRAEDEIQLLQVDSDDRGIMWGDCGIAHFFITPEALAARDFSKARFYWDCS